VTLPGPLDEADAELARWRERLAAAGRNVSELSELPDYGLARAAARGTGRLAEEARALLIGAAIERAEEARRGGSRLWRGEEAAQQAMAILRGPSITVDLAETPVLHRRLLAGPRATATVSPGTLLETMDAAYDRARESLTRLATATRRADELQARLADAVARLVAPGELMARLAAAALPDPLDRLEALEALAPAVDAAVAVQGRAKSGLDAARSQLAAVQTAFAAAEQLAQTCRASVAVALPALDKAGLGDLAAWVDRLAAAASQGRAEACLVGLANWRLLHDRLAAECTALAGAARAAIARRDDLVARFGALRAKQRARGMADPALDGLAAAAKASLAQVPMELDDAARDVAAYGAALARV
jgi:hypothetical protein